MGEQDSADDVVGHHLAHTSHPVAADGIEQRYEALEDLLAIAAHELKGPLTSLWLQLQLVQRKAQVSQDPLPSDVLLASLMQMDRQIRRLTVMVENLQDVSRSDAGKLMIRRESLDIVALIHEVVDRQHAQAVNSGSDITVSGGAPVRGMWDRVHLETAVTNLVSNAIKYGAGKSIEITIADEGAVVRVSIRDGGAGIAPHDQGRIFGRFERAAGSDGPRGLGLGLYIVRGIVDAHGGTVWVESELGEGAVFILELPK